MRYAPTTRTVLIDGLVAMMPAPAAMEVGNDAQAQPTSNVPARFAPSLCWSTTEVAGEVDVLGLAARTFDGQPGGRQRDVGRGPGFGSLPAGADPARLLHLVDEVRRYRVEAAPEFVVADFNLGQVPRG